MRPFETRGEPQPELLERRFMSRVDGSGGWFVPPLWALSDYVPFARPKRVLLDLCTSLPLPQGTDSINIPRITTGTASGVQSADGGYGLGRDLLDSAILNVPVRTVASIADCSLQWVEQSGMNQIADELIHADLLDDYDAQLTGLIMVGSGVNGQPTGLIPAGVVGNTAAINVANSNNVTPQTVLTAASGATLYTSVHQAASLVARLRAVPSSSVAVVMHPWQWEQYASLVTTTNQPVVIDQDPQLAPGQAGWWNAKRVYTDPALATSFGGTGASAPQMGAVSAGQFPIQAGSGASALYSVALAGRFADSWLFERTAEVEPMFEVLSGDLQVRFRLKSYIAFVPGRYVSASAVGSVAAAGAAVSYAVVNQYQTNSPWQLSSSGF